ncbi:MAG TPA: tetratricopeptide repeat protein, partial [Candidatus Binataceae bacterium]|nr:tetratricopeptide repeat protein [Candidatus Binataceae bacterium]
MNGTVAPSSKQTSTLASWCLAGEMAVAGIVYSRCLGNAFVFDDLPEIVYNRYLGNWSFLWKSFASDGWWFVDPNHLPQSSYYRPLLDVWLWLNYHLFGLHASGWHAAMVALHLIVVWLAYRTASLLADDQWTGVLAAGLFGLMPIHAQAVIWPAAISYPLCAAFELAAFEFYLHAADEPNSRRTLAISLGFFGGALLTYEGAVTFPFLIAAHAWIVSSSPDRMRRTFAAITPYAVEFAAYFILRFAVLGFIARPYLENHMTAWEIILTLPAVVASYAAMLAIPWMAAPTHRIDTVHAIGDPAFYFPLLGLAVASVALFLLFRNHPRRKLYLFSAAWILSALAPMLNIGQLQDQLSIQDRYLYLASFGVCLFAADLAVSFARLSERRANAVWIGAGIVAVCYALALYWVQGYWRDEVSLFSRCVEIAPDVGPWHSRLGLALEDRGDYRDARPELERAIALDPYTQGNVYYDLGLINEKLGDAKAAAHWMAEGLKRYDRPPPIAYTDVAIAQDAAGDTAAAEETLRQAEKLPGGKETAAMARAQIRFLHGDKAGAESGLRTL